MADIDPETGLPVNDDGTITHTGEDLSFQGDEPAQVDVLSNMKEALAGIPSPGEDPDEIQMSGNEGEPVSPFGDDPHFHSALAEVPAPGESVKKGQSTSFNGYTEAGKKYSADVFGQADKRADEAIGRVRQETEVDLAGLGEARTKAQAAIDKQAQIDEDHFNERLDIHRHSLEFQQKQAELETLAFVHSKAEAQHYIANYQQEMAGVRQLMNSTGNPLTGLSTTRKAGLGAAAFAQGMLAVKGININVVGQIDKWVDREMQAHQQMIQNKTQAANSQLTLYGLARQGAKDDWESRQKLRGFVIDGLKTQIIMEADKYRSASATADAMAKAAQLDILQAQNTVDLHEKIRMESLNIKKAEVDRATAVAHAARESQSNANDMWYKKQKLELDKDELERKYPKGDAAEDFPTPIADPTSHPMDENGQPLLDPKTGKPVDMIENKWVPDTSPGVDAGMRSNATKKLSEYNANYDAARHAISRLRDLKAQADKDGLFHLNPLDKMTSEKFARYKNQINTLVAQAVKADSGLVANEGEFQRHMALIDERQFYQAGDNSAMIEDFENNLRDSHRARVDALEGTGIRRMTAKELKHSGQWRPRAQIDNAGEAASNLRLSGDADVQKPAPYVTSAIKAMGSGLANEKSYEGLPNADVARQLDTKIETLEQPTKAWKGVMGDIPQPAIAKEVEDLYRGLINPDKYRETHPVEKDAAGMPSDNKLLRQNLLNTMKKIGSEAKNPEVRTLANRLVGIRLAKDPTPQQTKWINDMFAEE